MSKLWNSWGPRRTCHTVIAVLVFVTCAYFAAWDATKKHGVLQLKEPQIPASGFYVASVLPIRASSPMPLVVTCDEISRSISLKGAPGMRVRAPAPAENMRPATRRYYVWLFGSTIKLPFERYLPRYE